LHKNIKGKIRIYATIIYNSSKHISDQQFQRLGKGFTLFILMISYQFLQMFLLPLSYGCGG